MNVTAILVTRGDVDLDQIITSFPKVIDEVIVWDNSQREDLAVYGRYAAIEEARNDLIYVQDDDVLHTSEGIEEIIKAWKDEWRLNVQGKAGVLNMHSNTEGFVVCNMPANFRHAFYQEHALVGFGAVFHRDAPQRAFARMLPGVMASYRDFTLSTWLGDALVAPPTDDPATWPEFFHRTCDIVFTGLTPYTMVDVDYQDMPWATADNRMWKQSYHREERARMLELVLKVRDE